MTRDTKNTFRIHFGLFLAELICIPAFLFELTRALGGNTLSWAYVFEWPLLAIFAVYMWWKLLHPEFTIRRARERPVIAPEYEGMLHAWQDEVRKLEVTRRAEEAEAAQRSGDEVSLDDE